MTRHLSNRPGRGWRRWMVLFVLGLAILSAGCLPLGGRSISAVAILESIQHVNKQVFIEHYNAVDLDQTEAPADWMEKLGIKQEFIVLIRGRVPAGFDLSQLAEDDIEVSEDGKSVRVSLPAPVVFEDNVSVDFERSRVLRRTNRCPRFLCPDPIETFLNQVLPEAEQLLIEAAIENGILEQAAEDGKAYYEQFLASLGFERVTVIVSAR